VITHQITEAFPWKEAPLGIRDKPIAPRSSWQNGVVERLIGSIRRECTDHIIVLGKAHLRRILKSYATNEDTSITDKDSPVSRSHGTHHIAPDPGRTTPPIP
jgi:hypothetical protein